MRREKTLWSRLDHALRATDLLLAAGGFRAIVLDMGDVPPEQARRVPLATWYRFRLQAEKSRTLLLLLTACGLRRQLRRRFPPLPAKRDRLAAGGAARPPAACRPGLPRHLERSRAAGPHPQKASRYGRSGLEQRHPWSR